MKYSQILAGAAIASVANAHTTIYNMWVDGVDQGLGNSAAGYIRSPPNNNPLKDITSKDMTCNVNNVATAKTIDVAAGAKLTLEWHHDSNSASDDIIDPSHVGPVMVYIAPTASNGEGDVWVKLAEDGYDGTTWAVLKLIANKGKHDVTIPSTLADGEYLIRGEIIALHEADVAYTANPNRGAQFYMECVQISVSGGGATVLPAGVPMPGTYKYTDPGVVFNTYGAYTSYTIPGPAVWDGTSSGSAPVASSVSPVASSTAAAPVVPSSTAAPVSSAAPVESEAPSSELEPVVEAPATSSAAPIASSAAAPIVSGTKSACKSKTTSASIVPVATSVKSACKSKTSAVVVPATSAAPIATSAAAPVASGTKSACKSKSIAAIGEATTLATVAKPVATGSSSATVARYQQCGGSSYTGSTTCAEGSTCKEYNSWYSQCL